MVLFEDCFDFKRPGSHSRSITYNIRKTNASLNGPKNRTGIRRSSAAFDFRRDARNCWTPLVPVTGVIRLDAERPMD